jgi:hypothetical protein
VCVGGGDSPGGDSPGEGDALGFTSGGGGEAMLSQYGVGVDTVTAWQPHQTHCRVVRPGVQQCVLAQHHYGNSRVAEDNMHSHHHLRHLLCPTVV